ncbi:flippase [Pseudobutyrivibrio ruminis]|uniref:flippase n=1 Tax=Pseudobutyrivibrio ruminis TaxID=46206 RepID=UPI00051B921A|nr:flippase [Pseudobutyrivibrio ruminis]
MAKKSIKKNYIYNVIYQTLMVFVPLITTPYISRVLGSEGVGSVSYAESITSYFVLFASMGIATFGQREISYYQDSAEERSRVFWDTKILGFLISGIVFVFYLAYALCKQDLVYIVLSANILVVFFDVTWFFYGVEEFGIIILRNAIIKILQILYYFNFVKEPDDIAKYALGLGMFTVLGNISLWPRLRKYIVKVPISKLHPFNNCKVVLSLFIPTIAIQIYTVLDKTMIGKITMDAAQNGYYEQATKLCRVVLTIVTSLGTVMIPRIGFYFKKQDFNGIQELMYKSYRFVMFLGVPLCLGLVGVASNLVPWFLGEEFLGAIPLVQILAFLIIAIGINTVTGNQYLIPTGQQNIYTKTVILGAISNFILNLFLIYFLEAEGAAVASVMAESIIAIVQLVYVRKTISIKNIIANSRNYILAGMVMYCIVYMLSRNLSSSVQHTLLITFVGACTYIVMLLITRDSFFMSECKEVSERIIQCKKKTY